MRNVFIVPLANSQACSNSSIAVVNFPGNYIENLFILIPPGVAESGFACEEGACRAGDRRKVTSLCRCQEVGGLLEPGSVH
jgi:hypothetical protein